MSATTGIAWTDSTFNVAWGCTKVSAGCTNCYADDHAARFGLDVWGKGRARKTFGAKHWNDPRRWNRAAERAGVRRRVFCSSMCDVFEDHPTIDAQREKLWPLIAETPWLDWQILTKRADRMRELAPRAPLPNVWLGVSAENQEMADARIPLLLGTPAAVRFVSAEPLLGPINLKWWIRRRTRTHLRVDVAGAIRNRSFAGFMSDEGRELSPREAEREMRRLLATGVRYLKSSGCDDFDEETGCRGHAIPGLDWIIVGGESGPRARVCDVVWIRGIVNQAKDAAVPVFVKQLGARPIGEWGSGKLPVLNDHPASPGEWVIGARKGDNPAEWPEDLRVQEMPA